MTLIRACATAERRALLLESPPRPTSSSAWFPVRLRRSLVSLVLASSLFATGNASATAQVRTHVVQQGETLWSIASAVGTDTRTLVRENKLQDGSVLRVGQVLNLPDAGVSTQSAQESASHLVLPGESLFRIAKQYGVSIDSLANSNSIEDPARVAAGTKLQIPAPPPSDQGAGSEARNGSASRAVSSAEHKEILTSPYIVQSGETLHGLAQRFNTTVGALAAESNVKDPNLLAVGTVLKVPVPARKHVIQRGETMYSIAAQEKVDLGLLVSSNQVRDPSRIRVGEVLLVPASSGAGQPLPGQQVPPAPVALQRPAASLEGVARQGLVGEAIELLGFPYVFGGSGPGAFDCSGLVWYAAKQMGKQIGRGIFDQYDAGAHPTREQLKPGDVVFFQNTYMPGLSHNGIYIGNGRFIHAADESTGVTVSEMDAEYWKSRFFGATRLP